MRNFTCVVCKAPVELKRLTLLAHGKYWTILVPVCVSESCLERNAEMVVGQRVEKGSRSA